MQFPTFAYPGGKARLAPTLVSFMPPQGRSYVEPFAGRGNVFWAAASSGLDFKEWVLNDIRTAPFFEAIRATGDTVEVPIRSREEYYQQWEGFKQQDFKAVLLEPYLTFGGGGYGAGVKGVPHSASAEGYAKTMRACHDLMVKKDVLVTSFDWAHIAWPAFGPEDFVYFDPPYIGADVKPYRPGDLKHEDLVRLLKEAKFRWMLSEYRNNLYVRELGEPFLTRDVQLKATNYRQDGGKERRVECVWKNY